MADKNKSKSEEVVEEVVEEKEERRRDRWFGNRPTELRVTERKVMLYDKPNKRAKQVKSALYDARLFKHGKPNQHFFEVSTDSAGSDRYFVLARYVEEV